MLHFKLRHVVFNDPLRPYEYIVSTITYNSIVPSFDTMSVVLLIEYHRLYHHNLHLGDEEALSLQFHERTKISTSRRRSSQI